MSEEKYGVVRKIPIQCACGKVDPCAKHGGIPIIMRWCGACGAAICPDCWPKENKDDAVTCKCRTCIDSNRELAIVLAGMEAAQRREMALCKAVFGEDFGE